MAVSSSIRDDRGVRSARWVLPLVAVLLTAACQADPTAAPVPVPTDGPLAQRLTASVQVDGAVAHLEALQDIADRHGGTRAAGTPGYAASVDHVAEVLRTAGFAVDTPPYAAPARNGGPSRNVVAQTRSGDPGRVVMIGAHLDSVPDGPGIVDDGSGVATLLEIATRLGPEPETRATVRFAFFGNEETEAEGSTGYVDALSADELRRIDLYLNVDMVASPNGGYFAQGGVGDDVDETGPAGSATVGRVLADRLRRAGVTDPEVIAFTGDDESAFADAGIPVGGAVNGDADEKTSAQARAWGGRAGAVYDPCYHEACDRIENVDRDVLGHFLPAIAGALADLATSPEPLRGR